MLRRPPAGQRPLLRQQEQGKGRVRLTCRPGLKLEAWQRGSSPQRAAAAEHRPPPTGGAPRAAPATAAAAASLPASAAPAATTFELDIGELLVGRSSELERASRRAVHSVERLEHRLQRRATALPAGVRRLLAGGLAGAAGKTSTAPLEAIKMQLVQSGGMTAWRAAGALWRRGGARAFFRGNSLDVLRTIPSRSIELSSYEWYKRVMR